MDYKNGTLDGGTTNGSSRNPSRGILVPSVVDLTLTINPDYRVFFLTRLGEKWVPWTNRFLTLFYYVLNIRAGNPAEFPLFFGYLGRSLHLISTQHRTNFGHSQSQQPRRIIFTIIFWIVGNINTSHHWALTARIPLEGDKRLY